MQRGGNLEPDYQRPTGQSYNPRPARIALIGIKDANIKDVESVQLLILSCLLENGQFLETITPDEIIKAFPIIDQNRLAKLAELQAQDILSKESFSNPELPIYLCLFIDRMRHSHLSHYEKIKEIFLKLDPDDIDPTHLTSKLKLIIKNWREKMKRQFPELTK